MQGASGAAILRPLGCDVRTAEVTAEIGAVFELVLDDHEGTVFELNDRSGVVARIAFSVLRDGNDSDPSRTEIVRMAPFRQDFQSF